MFEKVLVVFAVLSLGGKFIPLPEAGFFFIVSMCLLALIYFLFGYFLFKEKATSFRNKFLSVFTGIAFAVAISGVLFKVMFWPGGAENLIGGIVLSFVTMFISIRKKSKSENDTGKINYYKGIILRSGIIMSISGIFFALPTNELIRLQFHNNPNLAEMIISCREKNGEGSCWEEIKTQHENEILQKLDNAY